VSDRPAWEQSASKRRQIALIAGLGVPAIATLGRTWRYVSEGAAAYDEVVAAGQRPILAFWHGRILPATIFWRDRGIIALAMTPGWVRTDMGGSEAALSVEESVRGQLGVIDRLTPSDAGRFVDQDGVDQPW